MATRTQIFREVLREYDALRTAKMGELRQRKESLYEALPRLGEIEAELSLLGVKTARLALNAVDGNMEEALQGMKGNQQALEAERSGILAAHQISLQQLQMEYACAKCQDTGYLGTERCLCLKRRLMDKLYDQSNVRDVIQVENFDHFKLEYYSEKPISGSQVSPRENAQRLFRKSIDFVKEFGSGENLLMFGSTGLGKTFLCNCIAKDLLDQGYTVLYLTAGQLFKRLEEQRFHREDDEEAKDWDAELLDADLLIIDDLGTEFSTVFTASELFRIINDRKLSGRSVVISTNLTPNELTNHYSDRVTSRLMGEYQSLKFVGQDIRLAKKFQR